MGLLKFLFISILVLYLFRVLVRMLLPMLFQSVVNRAAEQAGQQQYREPKRPREGSIKIDHAPPVKKSSVPDSEGDFVDYEEIK
ncbi:DUF4834 domain-containing protein [Mucilaginibacter myungsuensis]|uniref:DUF4834 domain-containing protein n=1 Tax=Mucilaginibacter myungsuensis TaxID=649104 RepID=A0A929PYT3_9SPHI|nr:DUF4834 domain-containing protein [Mucilaginibacter myungsuensis]MBE9663785.1 DUF4834 domain-containing protein [Mucilaginibacter myungsuensis]MDN3598500.1 DUF4834 domain-containing protein [Mucilaginibacter myungsuensis]